MIKCIVIREVRNLVDLSSELKVAESLEVLELLLVNLASFLVSLEVVAGQHLLRVLHCCPSGLLGTIGDFL